MPANNLLPLIQEVVQAFSLHYQEAMQPVLNQYGFRGGDWLRTFIAYGVDPEPVTMTLVQNIFPYSTPAVNRDTFIATTDHGLLERLDQNGFRLSLTGREGMAAFYKATGEAIADLMPLPEETMNRLADLLHRIVLATETADIPTHKSRLSMSRKSDPGLEAAAPTRIDQYLTDLTNYRNDAEQAAWIPLNVSGPAWEAFGYIAENGGQTAEAISRQFTERRGCNNDEYTDALNHLVAHGWLSQDGDIYSLTDKGQEVRDEAANTANRYFYAGWQALTNAEQAEVETLLNNLNVGLRREGMKRVWQLANGALGAAGPLYVEKTRAAMNETGLNKPAYFITLWQGLGLEPQPISVTNLHRRAPYSGVQALEERFANMAADGFLATTDHAGDYSITPAGREACVTVDNIFTAELSQIEILSENGFNQLLELLEGIVEGSATQEDETDKWNINTSRNVHRGADAAPQVKIDEYLDDLNAFRDDAHLAAYSIYAPGLRGQAMEAYTFLWRDGLNTAAALQERLAFRGYNEASYEAALNEMVALGLAVERDGAFTLTEEGHRARAAVEQKTDDIFFAAWTELSNAQLAQLLRRLLQLRRNLQTLVSDKIVAERKDLWPQVEAIAMHLDTFWGEVTKLQPIPEPDIERVNEFLERIVAAIVAAVEPARPNFEAMQQLRVPEDASALVRIDHALDCINAFRDDAHLATFQVSGIVWEALGDIWQGVAKTADAIAERHPNRGYTSTDYAQALSELVQRGWLSETEGLHTLTERGQTVRDEAETLTDRYFYAPWGVLNLDEIQELRTLLPQLEAGLKQLAEPIPA